MSIIISGSIAYDRIMSFSGKFQDHILPDKLHMLNVSFMTDRIEEKRGGTAGNIAYNLALLGEKPLLYSTVGGDFVNYAKAFTKLGIKLDTIIQSEDHFTACAYITTDSSSNQITGFSPAAMSIPYNKNLFPKLDKFNDIGVIAPGNLEDMRNFVELYKTHNIRWVYDPGQQIIVLTKEDLIDGITGAEVLVVNDYELEMICKKTGKTKTQICKLCKFLITTYGEKGSIIEGDKLNVKIDAVKATQAIDPTGAGDAYRAGVIKGLYCGLDIAKSAKLGAVCATSCVEHYGTQEHTFNLEEVFEKADLGTEELYTIKLDAF